MMIKQHRSFLFLLPLALAALLLIAWGGLMPATDAQAAPDAPLAPNAASLFNENFDYGLAAGPLISVSSGNWITHSGTTGPVQYITSSLSLPGYLSSGIGGSAAFSGSGVQDVNRPFAVQSSETVYAAALVKIASAGNTGTYFLHLKDSGTMNFVARVFARNSSGNLQFGFSNSSTAAYAATNFSYNQTYLLVTKFDTQTGNGALYVLDTYKTTEPVTPLLTSTGSALGVSAFAIRQASGGPVGIIDGIRVATNWDDAVASIAAFALSKSAPSSVYVDDVFTYTLAVTNYTGVTVNQVTLTDTLPLSTTFNAASDGGVLVGDVISWTIPGDFLADEVLTRTFSVIAPVAGAVVNSDYAVSASDWLTPTFGEPVTTQVALLTTVDLSVSKNGPAFGMIGGTLEYFINLTTQGLVSATQVVLTDTLPAGLAYLSDTSGITPLTDTGKLVWSLPDVAPDSTWGFKVIVAVSDTLSAGTVITNQVTVATNANGDLAENNTASLQTTLYPLVSIYDIQHAENPGISDSSVYSGTRVWVDGVVTAEPGEIDNPDVAFAIQQPGGGPWSGLWVYKGSQFESLVAPEGTQLRVLGLVKEYYGFTEIDVTWGDAAIEELGWLAPLTPTLITTGQLSDVERAISEPWESVLVEFQEVDVTDDNLGYGEWYFDDGSGPVRANDLGEKDDDLTYAPNNGDHLTFVRGIPMYSFDNYKLEPRYDADIAVQLDVPVLTKSAPLLVDAGAAFTYTLTLENKTGFALDTVVISDALPANAALAAVLDGGAFDGETLTWAISSLPDQGQVQVRFVVTATDSLGTAIWNDDYAVAAANYITPTFGVPVITVVGSYLPIPIIQGAGNVSPLDGASVTTQGVVVGLFEGNYSSNSRFNGFYLQDALGDGDLATSDGIFVNYGNNSVDVAIGDLLAVTGTVQEFDEYDAAACEGDCLTQVRINANSSGYRVIGGGVVTPTVIDPLGDPVAGAAYFESIEGMLVELPMTATVVGPTSYGAVTVIPGDEPVSRVLRHSPQEGMPFGVRHWLRYGGSAPELSVGSVIAPFTGPFTWSFGWYMAVTQPEQPWTTVYTQTLPAEMPTWPAPVVRQFSVAAFNAYNFDEMGSKLEKVVLTIQQLNGPTVLALEEISPTAVIPNLIGELAELGYHYDYTYSHPDTGGHGVALLWNRDVITDAVWSTDYQSCSPYGSSSSTYDPLWDTCAALGEYPLFARRPVVMTATLILTDTSQQVVFIANHFKAKGDPLGDIRRVQEAEFVNQLVTDFVAAGSENVVVMGDLNDFEDSVALEALYNGDVLTSTWYTLPAGERYSYIYNGISQVLDHILVSPSMLDLLVGFGPLHLNANYPYGAYYEDGTVPWRTSDHEPLAATFEIPVDVPPPPTGHKLYLPVVMR